MSDMYGKEHVLQVCIATGKYRRRCDTVFILFLKLYIYDYFGFALFYLNKTQLLSLSGVLHRKCKYTRHTTHTHTHTRCLKVDYGLQFFPGRLSIS